MYRKLAIIIAIIFLMPVGIAVRNEYITGFGVYNTGFFPEVSGYGNIYAFGIFFLCIVCIVIGLIIPKLVVLTGTKTRKNVLVIYSAVAFSSILVFFYEVPFLERILRSYENENIKELYERIELSMTTNEIQILGHEYSKYIGFFTKEKENLLQVGYPSTFSILRARNTGILLNPLEYDAAEILNRKIVLLVDGEVINTKYSYNNAIQPIAEGGI